jgi:hypothetical protein
LTIDLDVLTSVSIAHHKIHHFLFASPDRSNTSIETTKFHSKSISKALSSRAEPVKVDRTAVWAERLSWTDQTCTQHATHIITSNKYNKCKNGKQYIYTYIYLNNTYVHSHEPSPLLLLTF